MPGISWSIWSLFSSQATSVKVRDRLTGAMTVSGKGKILVKENIADVEAVGLLESAVEQRLRYLEPDEVVIIVGRIEARRHLNHVEAKLHHNVFLRIIGVGNDVTVLLAYLRIQDGHRSVHRQRMADIVSRVVRQRAQGEGVLVEILSLPDHRFDEVGATNIVEKVAEEGAAERVIAHVLDDATSVSVGVGFA